MRILSDEEDERFRQRIREEIVFHHEPGTGWEPVEIKDVFTCDGSVKITTGMRKR